MALWMTENLRGELLHMVRETVAPAVREVEGAALPTDWGLYIYTWVFEEFLKRTAGLPATWFPTLTSLVVVSVGLLGVHRRFSLPRPLTWPGSYAETDVAQRVSGEPRVYLKSHPVWDELVAEYKQYRAQVTFAKQQAEEFLALTSEVLQVAPTVGSALAVCPALRGFLPMKYAGLLATKHTSACMPQERLERLIALAVGYRLRGLGRER